MSVLDNGLKYQLRGPDDNAARRAVSLPALLLTGMFVLSLAGAIKSNQSPPGNATAKSQESAADPQVSGAGSGRAGLSANMALALESVAQRYRVAPEALQPIFLAAQAAAKDLDPLLIIAVIGIESGFNPFAQSVMGAQGLMQVIPRYHREKLPPEAGNAAFLDPINNVRVGAQVLHESIRRQGGLMEGLQYYAGATDDPERGYANRVLAEKQRLELAVRGRKTAASGGITTARQQAAAAKDSQQKTE
jgi:hypothetical protein